MGNTLTVTECHQALQGVKNAEEMDERWGNHRMGNMMSHPDRPERSVNAPPTIEWIPTSAKGARSSAGAPRTLGLPL